MPRTANLEPYNSDRDSIAIKNLQLPHGIIAPDVWGNLKEQPALVSINLQLHGGFASAANLDQLDDSTIHYGLLAKKIRRSCTPNLTVGDLLHHTEGAILELAKKGSGDLDRFIVARSIVEIALPKASMFGERVLLLHTTTHDRRGNATSSGWTFSVHDIKVAALIGVNSYERNQKQPLVVSIMLHLRPNAQTIDANQMVVLFGLERLLAQVIQDTSFETLETLANVTILELRKTMLESVFPGSRVQLRIEKPRAIAFADAPAVEVIRDVPFVQVVEEAKGVDAEEGKRVNVEEGKRVIAEEGKGVRADEAKGVRADGAKGISPLLAALRVVKPYD